MDIEDIRKHYEKMSDNQFIRLLTTNAKGLRPEVFEIIQHEIEKRNLSPSLLEGALAQNKEYTLKELEVYAELIRKLPCPVCGNSTEKLNATLVHTVKSFLIFTSSGTEPIVACPNCLDKKNKNAMISTALLGWWGIPWGVLKTPLYLYRNFKAKKTNHVSFPNDVLLAFILENVGEIETYKNNREMLKQIIKPQ